MNSEREIAKRMAAIDDCTREMQPVIAAAGAAIKAENFERAAELYEQAAHIFADASLPTMAAEWMKRAVDCRDVVRLRALKKPRKEKRR